jgi:hypothetical protein
MEKYGFPKYSFVILGGNFLGIAGFPWDFLNAGGASTYENGSLGNRLGDGGQKRWRSAPWPPRILSRSKPSEACLYGL